MLSLIQKTRYFAWKWFCQTLLFITGWTLEHDPSYRDVDRQVAVFPHTSGWELILALLAQSAYDLKHVKIIVWNGQFTGLMGPILKWLGCVPIENRKSTGAVKAISDYLNSQEKFKFCISPEGSRAYREKFRSGFFYIAQNTHATYNVVRFDYEKHIIHYGLLLESTGDLEKDCERLGTIFGESIPLHPDYGFYGSLPHSHTSMMDWLTLSTLVGIPNTWLLWHYHHPWFALMSLCVTVSSLLYHHSKETVWRGADWISSTVYLTSLLLYRWFYTGVIWKTGLLLVMTVFLFLQAGENTRYKNKHYRKWHLIYHLSTFPIAIAEIWINL